MYIAVHMLSIFEPVVPASKFHFMKHTSSMSLAVSPSMSEGSRGNSVAWGGVIRRPGHTSQWNSGRWVTDTRTPDYGEVVAQREQN